jgi:helicase
VKRVLTGEEESHIEAALDTIRMGKQALIFFGSRRSAEKAADDVSAAIRKRASIIETINAEKLQALSTGLRTALSTPTKQCERLANAARHGAVFHHSGLAGAQRSLIEEAFRDKTIRVICATPTLAAGVDLPSFRTIIRDSKRFGNYGMQYIPVLEYLQMAGRSGRPSYDEYGESILIAKTSGQKQELYERYILGEPEEITSKLAAEPALRTHILALVANGIVSSIDELERFISRTFYAYQYRDQRRLTFIIEKITHFLSSEGFITSESNPAPDDPFVSAADLGGGGLSITPLGKRVSELYLDPLSASLIVRSMRSDRTQIVGYVHLLSLMLELRPLPSVRKADHETIESFIAQSEGMFLIEPDFDSYEELVKQAKLSVIILSWLDEMTEDKLYETFDITPGHLFAKLDICDWLCYSASEIAAVLSLREHRGRFQKLRTLLKYGIREELLPLVRIRGIGRKRARMLYDANILSGSDIADAPIQTLARIVGEKTALSLKARTREAVTFDTQRTL